MKCNPLWEKVVAVDITRHLLRWDSPRNNYLMGFSKLGSTPAFAGPTDVSPRTSYSLVCAKGQEKRCKIRIKTLLQITD